MCVLVCYILTVCMIELLHAGAEGQAEDSDQHAGVQAI